MSRALNIGGVVGLVFALAAACGAPADTRATVADPIMEGATPMSHLKVTSTAFEEGDLIPAFYTCDGRDVSPPLSWTGGPERTVSYGLLCDDPDAPVGDWVHWLVFNLPKTVTSLKEAIAPTDTIVEGAVQATNSWNRVGYGGPCPPSGTHRYFFKVYALDARLSLNARAVKRDFLRAIEGHILAEGTLMGKYHRRR
jgi:Raf kinase inhibitor-like YbhB/YbcL family protein